MSQSILAVDDEVHMLRLLERILGAKTSYDIATTANSLEVPEILAERRFDLVLSDLKMPGMDGLDILRWLKEHGRSEEVIIITAFGSMESAIEALSLGVFDYITKPFKKEQILFTVERAMRWQRERRTAAEWRRLLETEPFDAAESAFRSAYMAALAARCGGDRTAVGRRSGLPATVVDGLLDQAPVPDGSRPEEAS